MNVLVDSFTLMLMPTVLTGLRDYFKKEEKRKRNRAEEEKEKK